MVKHRKLHSAVMQHGMDVERNPIADLHAFYPYVAPLAARLVKPENPSAKPKLRKLGPVTL